MQHTIELDQQAEQKLSIIATDNEKPKNDILLLAVKDLFTTPKFTK
ncbi:MAG: hypothetical protein V3V22_08575 [Methylococcales bacterium]